MPSTQIFPAPIVEYYPAQIYEGKEWYVGYHVFNPFSGKLQRKKIKLQRFRTEALRRKMGRAIAKKINEKLETGWNPFREAANQKSFATFCDAADTYIAVMEKEREANSLRSYRSYTKRIKAWLCDVHKTPGLYACEFSPEIAAQFMLWIKLQPRISPRSYNNNLIFYKSMFSWLAEFGYVAVNPFSRIKKNSPKLTKKVRRALTMDELRALVDLLQREHPRYLAACMLTYYCFLRPDDIVHLRAGSFNLEAHTICVRAEDTKNDHTSYKTIPLALEPYLAELNIGALCSGEYVFSDSKKFTPGTKKMDSREIARCWQNVVRKRLGWGRELQFYSLKDTGITNLLADGVGASYVQGQADHSSLEVTSAYVATRTPEGHEAIRLRARKIE